MELTRWLHSRLEKAEDITGELEERTTEITYLNNRKKILNKLKPQRLRGVWELLMKDATFTLSETWKEGQTDKSSKT